ncbi:DNA-directed RNA polymerase subunit beta [Arenivirga flava]|uniref:DNA-directed RNA polymerase subunit beta n=1 Tax=Arenivirga flava TaxID=1930060 RepID=A0AA37URU5_9MICO|nr:DNA-directed RNA polymerase subunit beta [Arenivirga flava]GMA29331.1 hypothetical protein GCM10025874_25840 [Arenivirga flava]
MADDFHKPTLFAGHRFDVFEGAPDPAQRTRAAHETAQALLARVREGADPAVVERLVHFTDEHGLETVAELWSHTRAETLPGALWRVYLTRAFITHDATESSWLFQRGVDELGTIDPVVAGAADPAGPADVLELSDLILRGVFDGDLAIALERAASFCRLAARGSTSVANDLEATEPERAERLTRRALRLSSMADELTAAARLWNDGTLD